MSSCSLRRIDSDRDCQGCGQHVGRGLVGWDDEPDPGPLCFDCLTKRDIILGITLLVMVVMRRAGEMLTNTVRTEEVHSLLAFNAYLFHKTLLPHWPIESDHPLVAHLRTAGDDPLLRHAFSLIDLDDPKVIEHLASRILGVDNDGEKHD